MKKIFSAVSGFIKKHKTISILLGIILVGLLWWSAVNLTPKPLGDKLEYIGKEDYGNIFGFDSRPYSVYYYGTDMNEQDIKNYFSKATYTTPSNDLGGGGGSPESRFTSLDFKSSNGDFSLEFYPDGRGAEALYLNKNSFKYKHLISIPDYEYNAATVNLSN